MDECYFDMLRGNHIQIKYFENLLSRRNDFANEAFETPVSDYFPNGSEERTPLEIAYHAMNPMYKLASMILDNTLTWEEIEDKKYEGTSSQQVGLVYQKTVELTEYALSNSDISNFTDEMVEYKGNEELLKQRFGIFTMHAMQHMGQAVKLQGLISEELANQ